MHLGESFQTNMMDQEVTVDSSVHVYKGFHSNDLMRRLRTAWLENKTLIVAPGHMSEVPYVNQPELMKQIPSDVVLGVFTSGTLSGKPRLVLYTKKNIESSLNAIRSLYDVQRIDKIFCYPQPTHAFGLILGYVHALIHDIPITFLEGAYSSKAHAKWVAEATPGMLTLGTPTHFIDLASWTAKNKIALKPTYSAIIGGAAVTKKLWNDLRTDLLIQQPSIGYGASEASPGITHLPPGLPPEQDGDIGLLLANVVMDGRNHDGFYFDGPNRCAGIIDENGIHFPSKIQMKDSLLKTASGHFIFEGRSDLMINRGGLKISPENMEGKIFSDLGLKSVCVPIHNERLGQDLCLVVQKKADQDDQNEIKVLVQDYLKKHFQFQLQNDHLVADDIPLNGSAKFDRVEAMRIILRNKKMQTPFPVQFLIPFMPHRSTAIWIDRLTEVAFRRGRAEVDLNTSLNLFTDGRLRESACIELVAQTYGYAAVAQAMTTSDKKGKANKTLIAEIRNAEFYFDDTTATLISRAIAKKIPLDIEATCSHDFGVIKVIQGTVKLDGVLLAKLSLKAFVAQ